MPDNSFRYKIHEIIFEADTPAGKWFDIALLILIVASVIIIMLETVGSIQVKYGRLLVALEWTFTVLFTIEYALRIYSSKRKMGYILSFYGLVDLVSIIPTYLGLFAFGAKYFAIVRAMRLLRVFRVLKMVQFLNEFNLLLQALKSSFKKILVFLGFVIIIIMIFGTLMYGIEGGKNSGFTNIPVSIYWAIVTVTTVGYGDIAPVTPLGQFLSACLMIIGYAIIAVPTGIVGSEMVRADKSNMPVSTQVCQSCSKEGHDYDARNCKYCGDEL
ncbi:MAG: ion transporter [Chitinophagales bacterium]